MCSRHTVPPRGLGCVLMFSAKGRAQRFSRLALHCDAKLNGLFFRHHARCAKALCPGRIACHGLEVLEVVFGVSGVVYQVIWRTKQTKHLDPAKVTRSMPVKNLERSVSTFGQSHCFDRSKAFEAYRLFSLKVCPIDCFPTFHFLFDKGSIPQVFWSEKPMVSPAVFVNGKLVR